jgi:hypothetical protein
MCALHNVHLLYMKNITLSAQDDLIDKARRVAVNRNSSLNIMFREWLEGLNNSQTQNNEEDRLKDLWKKTNYARVGKKLSREEMNER